MRQMPTLETTRLQIRPLRHADLDAVHRILDLDAGQAEATASAADTRADRERWMQWTILGYDELARLYQPPYGERAVVLKSAEQVIGLIGYVPCLDRFAQFPMLRLANADQHTQYSPEFGLFWTIAAEHRRQGFASEASQAMIEYAFEALYLRRIIATTTYDNFASIGVMKRLGMSVERNPLAEPPWLQIVGLLENTKPAAHP